MQLLIFNICSQQRAPFLHFIARQLKHNTINQGDCQAFLKSFLSFFLFFEKIYSQRKLSPNTRALYTHRRTQYARHTRIP